METEFFLNITINKNILNQIITNNLSAVTVLEAKSIPITRLVNPSQYLRSCLTKLG